MFRKEEYLLKRRRKCITHKDLSEVLNCSQSLISRYETGDCNMSDDKIERYKRYIDQK